MRYWEAQPYRALSAYIRCFWAIKDRPHEGEAPAEPVLPDGCPEIVFNLGDPFIRVQGGGIHLQPTALVAGQIRQRILIRPSGTVDLFGVRLQPAGLSAALGRPIDEITDTIIELRDLFGGAGAELEDRINIAKSFQEQVSIFEKFFVRRLTCLGKVDSACNRAVFLIQDHTGQLPVRAVADSLGLSERQFTRRFKGAVGVAPKTFSRIIRFQSAVRSLQLDRSLNILDAALSFGYFDQSHLIRDFNEFAGVSPLAFFNQTHRVSDAFTGAV